MAAYKRRLSYEEVIGIKGMADEIERLRKIEEAYDAVLAREAVEEMLMCGGITLDELKQDLDNQR